MVDLGERHTVSLVEACFLKKLLGPTKAARVIKKTTASGMKGRKLAGKIKRAPKKLTEEKGSPVGGVQCCDNEGLRSLLFRPWR